MRQLEYDFSGLLTTDEDTGGAVWPAI